MRSRLNQTIDQQYPGIVRLHTGCCQREVATVLTVSRDISSSSQQNCKKKQKKTKEQLQGIEVDIFECQKINAGEEFRSSVPCYKSQTVSRWTIADHIFFSTCKGYNTSSAHPDNSPPPSLITCVVYAPLCHNQTTRSLTD